MTMLKLFKDPYVENMLDLFLETPSFIERSITKRTNVITNDDDYRIQVAVPGISKEDIKITVKNSVLSISYENQKTNDETFFFTSSFNKQYTLPDDVDEKSITSKLENGILEIVIPRSKKKSNERLITIN
jgi:HSP20 family protein